MVCPVFGGRPALFLSCFSIERTVPVDDPGALVKVPGDVGPGIEIADEKPLGVAAGGVGGRGERGAKSTVVVWVPPVGPQEHALDSARLFVCFWLFFARRHAAFASAA